MSDLSQQNILKTGLKLYLNYKELYLLQAGTGYVVAYIENTLIKMRYSVKQFWRYPMYPEREGEQGSGSVVQSPD